MLMLNTFVDNYAQCVETRNRRHGGTADQQRKEIRMGNIVSLIFMNVALVDFPKTLSPLWNGIAKPLSKDIPKRNTVSHSATNMVPA